MIIYFILTISAFKICLGLAHYYQDKARTGMLKFEKLGKQVLSVKLGKKLL